MKKISTRVTPKSVYNALKIPINFDNFEQNFKISDFLAKFYNFEIFD